MCNSQSVYRFSVYVLCIFMIAGQSQALVFIHGINFMQNMNNVKLKYRENRMVYNLEWNYYYLFSLIISIFLLIVSQLRFNYLAIATSQLTIWCCQITLLQRNAGKYMNIATPLRESCENVAKLELVYLPKGKYCVSISLNGLQAGHCDAPPPILHDRKPHSIAFFAISDQNATFFSQNGCRRPFWMTENHPHFSPFQINAQLWYFSQNGCRRPFWMTENRFRSHFSPFQINMQLWFFYKMAACGHFGWPKITFMHFSPFQINT